MLEVRNESHICIIKIFGEINNNNLEMLISDLEENIKEEYKVYLLNLSNCAYISSRGFGYIVELYKKLKKEKKKLVLAGLVPDVKKLFQITKMSNIIEMYNTENDALFSLCKR